MFEYRVKDRETIFQGDIKRILHPKYLPSSVFRNAFENYRPWGFNAREIRNVEDFKHSVECGKIVILGRRGREALAGLYDRDGKLRDDIPIFLRNIERDTHKPMPVYSVVEEARKKLPKDVPLKSWREYKSGQDQISSDSYEPIRDEELAKSEGASPEQIEARKRVAKDFLVDNGFSEAQIDTAIGSEDGTVDGGFDLTKPVVVTSFPPPEQMSQYVASHGYPGNWFDPLGTQPATALGISDEGRTQKAFIVPEGKGLQGTSKPILDTWTNSENPVQTEGGGTQLFVKNDVRNEFIKLNNIG